MQTQVELAGGLGYIEEKLVEELMVQGGEVARLINGLVSVLGKTTGGEIKDHHAHSIG
jgi:hypothetical protein